MISCTYVFSKLEHKKSEIHIDEIEMKIEIYALKDVFITLKEILNI